MAMTDLEQTAMDRLRLASSMSLKLYKQPLLLTDSGGKDSAVICKLAENAGIQFEICHSHTTADAPETVYHVRKRAKEYEEKGVEYTIILPTYQGKRTSMWDLIPKIRMPPTRVARYCCAVLKETAGKDRFTVTGVRWAESVKRAATRGTLEVVASDRRKNLILNNDNEEDRQLGYEEVIHCKDCEFAEPYERMDGETGYYCRHPKHSFVYDALRECEFNPVKEKNDFCSYGERRSDEKV